MRREENEEEEEEEKEEEKKERERERERESARRLDGSEASDIPPDPRLQRVHPADT
jgi:hypothetical protein